jgi:hypothetical protein
MYRNCIFCSADLGANDVIEEFPVGSEVAFDAARGRLWAVCKKCRRWNLAPIEERWEAVEHAESLFRDSRMRVQSENIGLAKMRDGTRLVRIGPALAGELAAWRYGNQLAARRRRMYVALGAVVIGSTAFYGLPFLLATTGLGTVVNVGGQFANGWYTRRMLEKVAHRVDAAASPTGAPLLIRRKDLGYVRLGLDADNSLRASVRIADEELPWHSTWTGYNRPTSSPEITLLGEQARTLAARAMVARHSGGASHKRIQSAVDLLQQIGSAETLILRAAEENPLLLGGEQNGDERAVITPRKILGTWRPASQLYKPPPPDVRRVLHPTTALALEMALHDESERRAMEGELAQLEEAWRDAEYVARIADALPDDVD